MASLANFKYRINQAVYNQRNQKKGRVIQRNRVVDTNYYLLRMEETADKVWVAEIDLDEKSLQDKIFDTVDTKFATGGLVTTSSIWVDNADNWKMAIPYQPTEPIKIDLNQPIAYKTLTGMEAVDRIIYLNETILGLQGDLETVKTLTGKRILKEEIEKLTEEFGRIEKQLNYLKITYQEVK